ncbi:hypothetical protein MesoLjLb_19090 [Mesorhizobium sp. L-8-3]|nr:hypothetical protein MesoLjLb_19090 [Mesorhizobium sp. L-8-3]
MRNLHENAVEHMANGGSVAWRPVRDGCGVMVEDDGPGIPEEDLPLVIRRFYRGRHRSAAGTGLGLAIAELAAKRSGGGLMLRNRDGGIGLGAAILLPPTDDPEWGLIYLAFEPCFLYDFSRTGVQLSVRLRYCDSGNGEASG